MKLKYIMTDIQELSFNKNVEANAQFQIQTKTNYLVYYADDGSSCICDFSAEFLPIDEETIFRIKYRSKSLFNLIDCKLDDEIKKNLHVETFDRLYPIYYSSIANFTSTIGLPNIKLPSITLDSKEVNILSE